ncbi:hypothetical protein ACFLWL_01500 [Chloroflexota bacterium]
MTGEGAKRIAGEVYDKEFKLNFRIDHKVVNWLKKTLMKYVVVVEQNGEKFETKGGEL